eukprot:1401792-Prymnesium_polylepis.2
MHPSAGSFVRDASASPVAPFPTSAAATQQSRCAPPVGPMRLRFCPSAKQPQPMRKRHGHSLFASLLGHMPTLRNAGACSKQRTLSCLCWSAPAPRSNSTTSVLPRKAEMMSGVYPSCSGRNRVFIERVALKLKDKWGLTMFVGSKSASASMRHSTTSAWPLNAAKYIAVQLSCSGRKIELLEMVGCGAI